MRSRVADPILTEAERLSVLVTEMIRLGTAADPDVRAAARQILAATLDEPLLADGDRRLAVAVL